MQASPFARQSSSGTCSLPRVGSQNALKKAPSCGSLARRVSSCSKFTTRASAGFEQPNYSEARAQLEQQWQKQHGGSEATRHRPSGQQQPWFSESPAAALSSSDIEEYELIDGDSFTPFAGAGVARTLEEDGLEYWTMGTPSSIVFGSAGLWGDLDQVYVILFGVGRSATEGIYSLRALTQEEGLPQDTVVAFESQDDAERYAALLEATMDHTPSVCPIDPQELLEFCLESGYSCRLEAGGSALVPPDYNVGVTDWERSLRLRGGEGFSVLGGAAGPLEYDPAAASFDPEDVAAAAGGDLDLLGDLARQMRLSFPPYVPSDDEEEDEEGEEGAAAGPASASCSAGPAAAALVDPQDPRQYERHFEAQEDAALAARLDAAIGAGGGLDEIRARLERLLPDDD